MIKKYHYAMQSPFKGFSIAFINSSVDSMRHYERNMIKRETLLDKDEEMDFYLMVISAMQSEIGVY